jgi:hypothetical protein
MRLLTPVEHEQIGILFNHIATRTVDEAAAAEMREFADSTELDEDGIARVLGVAASQHVLYGPALQRREEIRALLIDNVFSGPLAERLQRLAEVDANFPAYPEIAATIAAAVLLDSFRPPTTPD